MRNLQQPTTKFQNPRFDNFQDIEFHHRHQNLLKVTTEDFIQILNLNSNSQEPYSMATYSQEKILKSNFLLFGSGLAVLHEKAPALKFFSLKEDANKNELVFTDVPNPVGQNESYDLKFYSFNKANYLSDPRMFSIYSDKLLRASTLLIPFMDQFNHRMINYKHINNL